METSTVSKINPVSKIGQQSPKSKTERRPSQCCRVYAELRRWYPHECPLPALHDLRPRISDITTRIWELRHTYRLGIENRMVRDGSEVHSLYRLVRDSCEAASAFGYPDVLAALDAPTWQAPITQSKPIENSLPKQGSGSLFGDLTPEPRYPD